MAVFNETKWVGIKPTVKTALEPGKQVDIAVGGTEILAEKVNRTSFTLVVRGEVNVFVKLGTAPDRSEPELEPGDVLSCDDYVGAVWGRTAAAVGRVDVFEV